MYLYYVYYTCTSESLYVSGAEPWIIKKYYMNGVRPSGTISTVPEECGYYRAITATNGMRLMIQSAAHLKFCKYVSLLVAAI